MKPTPAQPGTAGFAAAKSVYVFADGRADGDATLRNLLGG